MSQQTVPFRPEEFRALKTTIGSYLNYLEQIVPPSAEREREISVLQGMYTRLYDLLALGQQREGQRLWLTEVEVAAIDTALVTFASLVPLIIKPCPEQEDTLQELHKMRWRIRCLAVSPHLRCLVVPLHH